VKMLFGALGAALVVILAALGWMGALSPVQVAERDMGPYQFVYVQEASDDYSKIDELTDALAVRLDAAGVTTRRPAQVYFPAGRGVQNQVGFVVEQSVGPDTLGPETYLRVVPAQKFMVVEFPFRNRLSFTVGDFRVGPAFTKHIKSNKYAEARFIVILDGDRILYLSPISAA
jgi:hypothetical protein